MIQVCKTHWDWYKVWMLILSFLILVGNAINALSVLGVIK